MAKNSKSRKMYGVYLPGDTEVWFGVYFSNPDRARWYASNRGLEPEDYELREKNEIEKRGNNAA